MNNKPKPTLEQKIAFLTAAHELSKKVKDGFRINTEISSRAYCLVIVKDNGSDIELCRTSHAFFSFFSNTSKLTAKQNADAIESCCSKTMRELEMLGGLKK